MIVVILHCHFERGGVTQVVENHIRSLREGNEIERIILVSGHRQAGLSDETRGQIDLVAIDDFDYDGSTKHVADSEGRSQRISTALTNKLADLGVDSENAVLHWHNHSLGKNTSAPAVIRMLAENGWRLLLQIHDFAEDYRPENYRRLVEAISASDKRCVDGYLYPVADSIRYATLTHGDAAALGDLGIPQNAVSILPNSVLIPSRSLPSKLESRTKVLRAFSLPPDARWCLYPVRGIRRKNVGELLLLARLLGERTHVGLTLRPTTELEARSYGRWRSVAQRYTPNLHFDVGQHADVSFLENVRAADLIVSTSVAEGFGMAYLEPWLMGREVIARRLPGVTMDFESTGIDLKRFYDRIPIPGERSWLEACRSETSSAERQAWSELPTSFRPVIEDDQEIRSGTIDFARLTTNRQIEILQRMSEDEEFEKAIREHSKDLLTHLDDALLDSRSMQETIRQNAEVVRSEYSATRTAQKLSLIYGQLVRQSDSTVRPPTNAGSGVDLISAARPYYPCRTEVLP